MNEVKRAVEEVAHSLASLGDVASTEFLAAVLSSLETCEVLFDANKLVGKEGARQLLHDTVCIMRERRDKISGGTLSPSEGFLLPDGTRYLIVNPLKYMWDVNCEDKSGGRYYYKRADENEAVSS